jgi:hypothetical protein
MTQLDAITHESRGRAAAAARSGAAVAVLLALLAIAALAEVLASAAVLPASAPQVVSWERAMQIGDEARQRGDVPAARRAYVAALFRARGERSLPGVLDAAERFAALGDRDVVEHALGMAAPLGGADRDDETQRRLQALRDQLGVSGPRPLTVSAPR